MTDTDDSDVIIKPTVPDVGERLRKAREARQLSVGEAASQLRFTKETVLYLEQERWELLHGRTYARGYFSSYVKFLGLDHDELLQGFNNSYTDTARPTTSAPLRQQLREQKSVPWLPIVILLVLLTVAWYVWQNWAELSQRAGLLIDTDVIEEATMPVVPTEPSAGFSRSVEPMPSFESAPSVAAVDNNQISGSPSAASDFDSGLASDADDALRTELTQPLAIITDIQSLQATDSIIEAEPAVDSTDSTPTLQMSFSDECWVEVTDARARVLLSRVVRPGEVIELQGDLPLNVLLGRASAVTVVFNQQTVDIRGYIQGDVARFQLGAES